MPRRIPEENRSHLEKERKLVEVLNEVFGDSVTILELNPQTQELEAHTFKVKDWFGETRNALGGKRLTVHLSRERLRTKLSPSSLYQSLSPEDRAKVDERINQL